MDNIIIEFYIIQVLFNNVLKIVNFKLFKL